MSISRISYSAICIPGGRVLGADHAFEAYMGNRYDPTQKEQAAPEWLGKRGARKDPGRGWLQIEALRGSRNRKGNE
jgi:hypothetical protein